MSLRPSASLLAAALLAGCASAPDAPTPDLDAAAAPAAAPTAAVIAAPGATAPAVNVEPPPGTPVDPVQPVQPLPYAAGKPLRDFLPPGVAFAGAGGEAKPETFGAALPSDAPAIALAQILGEPDAFAGKTVVAAGKVREVCKKKGCWMELAAIDGSVSGARVTFENYGFFVPKDCAGSIARLQGVVEVKTVSRKDVDHLEAEGAKFAKKFEDGTAREVRIVATGVELYRVATP